jgi:starch phosphorylase
VYVFVTGEGWTVHLDQLVNLKPFASDPSFQRQFMQVKANNKMKLAQYLEQTTGVSINPASMFDIQVKKNDSLYRSLCAAQYLITMS